MFEEFKVEEGWVEFVGNEEGVMETLGEPVRTKTKLSVVLIMCTIATYMLWISERIVKGL